MALEELRSEYEEFAVELPVFPLSLTHPASHNTFPQERGFVHRANVASKGIVGGGKRRFSVMARDHREICSKQSL